MVFANLVSLCQSNISAKLASNNFTAVEEVVSKQTGIHTNTGWNVITCPDRTMYTVRRQSSDSLNFIHWSAHAQSRLDLACAVRLRSMQVTMTQTRLYLNSHIDFALNCLNVQFLMIVI